MKNFKQEGYNLDLVAPAGGVVSGGLYIIGALAVIANVDAAEGKTFVAFRTGVYELPKNTTSAPTQGAKAYWDDTNNRLTHTATDNTLIGVFPYGAANGDEVADVLLTGEVVG